jgi:hypothetical protein
MRSSERYSEEPPIEGSLSVTSALTCRATRKAETWLMKEGDKTGPFPLLRSSVVAETHV